MQKGYNFLLLLIAVGLLSACTQTMEYYGDGEKDNKMHEQLPRVLIVTTGLTGQDATLPKGIVIAMQAFNRKGAMVKLETRNILYKPGRLKNYNMIILSTAPGYHDADRKYSLSYMAEAELENLKDFVDNGGVLISGDNVGRNKPDGIDRIALHEKLEPGNYPLSECFGVKLTERNMEGYRIYGKLDDSDDEYLRSEAGKNFYTLVPDSIISGKAEIMANWVNASDTLPAIVKNRYGKGTAYLLASSKFLHPAGAGGNVSSKKIMGFYEAVVDDFYEQNNIPLRLNPWPGGHDYAFSVTMNSSGKQKHYKRFFEFMEKNRLTAEFFVEGQVDQKVKEALVKNDIPLQSSGYDFTNYRNLNYTQALQDMLRNENLWGKEFEGFRFPFTMPAFWGLMALSENDYAFDSSIGANNLEFIHGSVVPHNVVIADQGFYKTTDIVELAPVYNDDYYYFKDIRKLRKQSPRKMVRKTQLYQKYLENYWKYAVKPYRGLMVYQGHPRYVANNDTTIRALENLVDRVKEDDTWIAPTSKIADFRRNLMKMKFYTKHENERVSMTIDSPEDIKVEDVSIKLDFHPEEIEVKQGEGKIHSDPSGYYIVFDAFEGQKIFITKATEN
ncbi:MAG: beta-galactosidase trimerization domain-containing protein [Bacteroidales bacterium]|nr:beta-galactosidase trimerization domain-containing protein [Bacteroidales bacterium]MCF8338269.1 beta-galactosidase trimerization domain-containing protein [Bacteroidales bacterium]